MNVARHSPLVPPAKSLGRLLAPLSGAAAPLRLSSFLWGCTPNPRPAPRASSSARQLLQPRSNFRHAELALVLCLGLAPNTVSAAPLESSDPNRGTSTQDRALAEALFRDGQALIEAERLEDACAKFQESQRLEPALGTLLYLATCYVQVGKTASAWAAFQAATEAAHRAKDTARESLARGRARQLEAKLSRLEISVAIPVQGMVIHVDEHALGPGVLSTPLPFDPGTHVIEVTAPGKGPWSLQVELERGPITLKVRVPMLHEAIAQPEAAPTRSDVTSVPAPRPVQEESGFNWQLPGLVSLGVGGAGVLVGSYFGIRAYAQAKDADHDCTGQICTQKGLDGHADARRSAVLANVGFGVGVVGLAAGSYLVWFHDAKTKKESAWWLRTGLGEIVVGGDL